MKKRLRKLLHILDIRRSRRLRAVEERVHVRLGDNLYLIMLIMAVLLVFSGLLVGLLGRGWMGAWFLVLLGIILGFFPCFHYFLGLQPGSFTEDPGDGSETAEEPGPDIPPVGGGFAAGPSENEGADFFSDASSEAFTVQEADPASGTGSDAPDDTEAARWAVEIEALLAKDRQRREAERFRKEAELRREEQRILEEARRRERERILEEERKKEERERERRRRNEESRARWDKTQKRREYRRDDYSGNVYRPQNFTSKGVGYFDGIRSRNELKKKYKELVKQHHPDNGGNSDTMLEIQKQYKELDTFFASYEKHRH